MTRHSNLSKYLKLGKALSAIGTFGAVLSVALAFIPEDDTIKRTVLQIDSKVSSTLTISIMFSGGLPQFPAV